MTASAATGTPPPFPDRLLGEMAVRGPLCPGIDAHPALLRDWGLPESAAGARDLGYRVVEAVADEAAVVKIQVSFFERYGSAGYSGLEEVLARCRAARLLVIADAKRADIGSSAQGYADAWLDPGSPLVADAVTVSPYLGYGSLRPFVERAAASGRGVFVLAVTSNPEGGALQLARVADGGSIAAAIARDAGLDNAMHCRRDGVTLGPVGLVVGVTSADIAAAAGLDLGGLGGLVLAPGLGAQGGTTGDVRRLFGAVADRVIVAVGRDLLRHGPEEPRLRAALRRHIADTRQALLP